MRTGIQCSRAPIARMAVIAARLRKGLQVNCRGMAARLEVDEKTIGRDIDFMRDRLGYDLRWEQRRKTYVLEKAPVAVL